MTFANTTHTHTHTHTHSSHPQPSISTFEVLPCFVLLVDVCPCNILVLSLHHPLTNTHKLNTNPYTLALCPSFPLYPSFPLKCYMYDLYVISRSASCLKNEFSLGLSSEGPSHRPLGTQSLQGLQNNLSENEFSLRLSSGGAPPPSPSLAGGEEDAIFLHNSNTPRKKVHLPEIDFAL
jgi:hypothetical protein